MGEPVSADSLRALASRVSALADAMRFDFLYDRRRRIFSIGYRLADAEGPGRLDSAFYDSAGVGGAAGELRRDCEGRRPAAPLVSPRTPGHEPGRPRDADVLGRHDVRVPDAAAADAELSRDAARPELPRERPAPDRLRPPARRAVGDLGVGVRVHRSRRQLPVPGLRSARTWTQARAVRRARHRSVRHGAGEPGHTRRSRPRTSSDSRRWAWKAGSASTRPSTTTRGAATSTRRRRRSPRPAVVQAYFAHHQGMSLVALANVICSDAFVSRFHADPRVQATELLLQERVPREAILSEPRPAESTTAPPSLPVFAARRFRTPHTTSAHTHFLSNGRYTAAVTNAGGGFSMWGDIAVTRRRDDPHVRHRRPLHLPARSLVRIVSGRATYQPGCQEPDRFEATFDLDKITFRRRDTDIETQLEVTVSSEDDVEVRRLTIINRGEQTREDRGHQLRGDRARPSRGRPRAPGVRQAVRRDGVRFAERRPAVQPPAARAGRITHRRLPRARRRWTSPRRRCRVGDRPGALRRPRALARQPDRPRRPCVVGHHGRGARPDRRPAGAHPARTRRASSA